MRIIDADALYDEAFEAVRRGDLEYEEYDAIINYLDGSPTLATSCGECSFSRPAAALMASNYEEKYTEQEWICVLQDRLAAYEDRGCAPEEVLPKDKADEIAMKLMRLADLESLCSYARLRELAEADKDGRVVAPPCKVGDKLYRVFAGEIFEHRVGRMKYFAIQKQWDIETYPFCPCVESSIGKTIFLTRKGAEKALEAMRKGETEHA